MFQLRKFFNNHFQSKNSSFIFKQKGKNLKLFFSSQKPRDQNTIERKFKVIVSDQTLQV